MWVCCHLCLFFCSQTSSKVLITCWQTLSLDPFSTFLRKLFAIFWQSFLVFELANWNGQSLQVFKSQKSFQSTQTFAAWTYLASFWELDSHMAGRVLVCLCPLTNSNVLFARDSSQSCTWIPNGSSLFSFVFVSLCDWALSVEASSYNTSWKLGTMSLTLQKKFAQLVQFLCLKSKALPWREDYLNSRHFQKFTM